MLHHDLSAGSPAAYRATLAVYASLTGAAPPSTYWQSSAPAPVEEYGGSHCG